MSTLRRPFVSAACIAFLSVLGGCVESDVSAPIETVAYVDTLFTLDLETQETTSLKSWTSDELYDPEPEDLNGCRITPYDLPDGAWIDGTRLKWIPTDLDVGTYEVYIDYSQACQDRIPESSASYKIYVQDLAASNDCQGCLPVHDLEISN